MRRLLLSALLSTLSVAAEAAVTPVDVGTPLPRFSLIKPGTHHYLRYFRTAEGANIPLDIWAREVRFEQREGKQQMHIVQRWDGAMTGPTSPASVKRLDSWFETTFRPLSHVRITERDGKKLVEGVSFTPERVTGMPDLADNALKTLSIASGEPTFNFETDIEFLQALPLAEGYEASINFYHAGGSAPPKRYIFKVAGSESIAGPAGPVDCWIVTTDYGTPGAESTFWFAKGTQLMLRQESAMRDGKVLVKTMID